jgi:hypothetical protein
MSSDEEMYIVWLISQVQKSPCTFISTTLDDLFQPLFHRANEYFSSAFGIPDKINTLPFMLISHVDSMAFVYRFD